MDDQRPMKMATFAYLHNHAHCMRIHNTVCNTTSTLTLSEQKSIACSLIHSGPKTLFHIRTTKNLDGQPEIYLGCPWDNHLFFLNSNTSDQYSNYWNHRLARSLLDVHNLHDLQYNLCVYNVVTGTGPVLSTSWYGTSASPQQVRYFLTTPFSIPEQITFE